MNESLHAKDFRLRSRSGAGPKRGVPFGRQYPEAFRETLVGNGILNVDFTPNEATAARLGWSLLEPRNSESQHKLDAPGQSGGPTTPGME